jgi:hypothetical protein
MAITWTNIFIIIICVMMTGIIILLLIPSQDKVDYIILTCINSLPIPITYEQKTVITQSILRYLAYVRLRIHELPKTITQEVVKYVPKDIVIGITQGIPNDEIDPEKCRRIVVDTKFANKNKGKKIPLPKNLPWDGKVDYCKLREGTLDDVDLDEHISNNGPRIILY